MGKPLAVKPLEAADKLLSSIIPDLKVRDIALWDHGKVYKFNDNLYNVWYLKDRILLYKAVCEYFGITPRIYTAEEYAKYLIELKS